MLRNWEKLNKLDMGHMCLKKPATRALKDESFLIQPEQKKKMVNMKNPARKQDFS